MNDRHKYRIPMFTDKGHFIEYQYVSLGDIIEVMLCGCNGEPEQCTGLKDKNGKLIYENDVLKDGEIFAVVVWDDEKYLLEYRDGGVGDFALFAKMFEIIGNIHEQEVSE